YGSTRSRPHGPGQTGGQMAISELQVFGSFQPPDGDELALWLMGGAGVTTDGSNNVTSWTDLSGEWRNAVQPISGKRPSYVANAVNGLPALRFDGTDDFITAPGLTGNMDDFTVFFA